MTDASSSPRRVGMRARLLVVGLSLLVHFVSWIAPALQFDMTSGGPWIPRGWEVAFLGVQALLVGNVGWLANVFYAPSLIAALLAWWRTAAGLAAVALVVGLHSLALIGLEVPADEGNVNQMVLVHLRAGFYLWMSSMAVVVVGSLWCRKRETT
jgi:hypothetical protein